jgi:hypothetical protein
VVAGEAIVIGSLLAALAIPAVIASQASALRQIAGTNPYTIPWTDLGEIVMVVARHRRLGRDAGRPGDFSRVSAP